MVRNGFYVLVKLLICLWLTAILQVEAEAQSRRKVACDIARDLKNGTLVVVLKTDSKKIGYLEKFSRNGSQKEMSKYSAMLKKTMAERDSSWKYIRLGFSELYQFSDVVFLMDTSLGSFLKDSTACTYYNAGLSPVNTALKGKLFVCKYGHTFGDQSTNLQHAWYVMDSKLRRLPKPFPENVQFSLFNPSLLFKIPKEFRVRHNISRIGERQRPLQHALKLHNMLVKYYTKKGDCE